jgi:hypothetical protein
MFQRILPLIIVITIMVFHPFSAARAGGEAPFTPINPDALINGCIEKSQAKLDTGVTARMREGGAEIVRCYEKIILDQASGMFNPEYLSQEVLKSYLDKIRYGYQKLYWALYNGHKKCDLWCGTDKHIYHLSAHEELLEKIIRDMIEERNEVRF